MNYLMESRAFHESIPLNELSSGDIALWHCLLDINNKASWTTWFTVPNMMLQLYSGLSVSGIHKARNKLKQCGYIDFKTRGTKATEYHLIQLSTKDSNKDSVRDSNRVSNKDSVRDSNKGGNRNSATLYKQNKTKLNKTNSSDKSQATRHKTKPKFSDDATEMKLAMHLFAKIKENNPEHRPLTYSQKQTWADNIRLMIERDQRTPQQIKGMIDWCQQDDFWKQNILSTAKLRKQYDKMKIRANEEVKRRPASDLTFEERFARSQQNRSRQSELFEERFKRAQEARGVR